MVTPSVGISVTSSRMILDVRQRAEPLGDALGERSRSTASAWPAGTRCSSAHAMTSEPRRRISALRSPEALVSRSDFSELLQTSSASRPVWWTGVCLRAGASRTGARTPRRARHAKPPPPPPVLRR